MASSVEGTTSGAFFRNEAESMRLRLRGDDSPRGRELALEADRLLLLFDEWMAIRPSPEAKSDVIRRLFELHRAVNEHLGATSGLRASVREPKSGA
jgi:hypothetical protein